jgi:hypothetical protein
MTQLTIFFENVQMWREVRWSRVWGRKPRQELQRKRSHEEPQMIVYVIHGLNTYMKNKNLHGECEQPCEKPGWCLAISSLTFFVAKHGEWSETMLTG